MNKKINIAIDGPASSGKSTIARLLAKKYKYIYIDTGAMYRALTLLALQKKVNPTSEKELVALLSTMKINFQLSPNTDKQLVLLNGSDITENIRLPEITKNVSQVALHKKVREKFVELQKDYAKNKGVVMDGRDIGTVVLPFAEVKIFLVATPTERAKRRFAENTKKGITTDLATLTKEIEQRDFLDSTRKISPLKQAKDAILVDTTGISINAVLAKINQIVKKSMELTSQEHP